MATRLRRPSRTALVRAVALLLGVVAAALVPALRDERRLASAVSAVQAAPGTALKVSESAAGPATRSRTTAIAVQALARLGDLAAAERVAAEDARAHPDDPFAARRLYQIQVLRSDRTGARRTLRALRKLDPKFADGTGF